jgi:sugar phosphate isomerase/epimerase
MDRRTMLRLLGTAMVARPGIASGADAARSNLLAPGGVGGSLRSETGLSMMAAIDRIGVQLYTLRSRMAESVERTLHEVAQIGYKEVEFAGYFNRPPRSIRQLLDRNGLKAPSAHISMANLRSGWFRTLDESAAMGHRWLVIPSLGANERDSIDAVKRTAEIMNRAAADAKDFKIRLAYHNHDFEFREVEGRVMFDLLLEELDPKLVDIELDLYWITKAGFDPFVYFARWPGRFPLLHVKDAGPAPAFEMLEVGKGTIDFPAIFAKEKEAGFKHYFVEHDRPADPLASVGTSFRYLDGLR